MGYVVFLLGCLAPTVWCYTSGQVAASCESLQPQHSGLHPQAHPAPFRITTHRRKHKFREEVTVDLQAPGSKAFMGFLLQAQVLGESDPVGSFRLTTNDAQLLNCSHKPNSAVSHTSQSPKTSIQVIWTSGSSGNAKPIEFHASFVQNYGTFWVDVISATLNLGDWSNFSTTAAERRPTLIHQSSPPSSISGEDCGVTKVCFRQPSRCDPEVSANCYFMSATKLSGSDTAVRYEMTGTSDGYISFGFSDDQTMGNDDIYVCGKASDDRLRVQHVFSTGRERPLILPLGNISDLRVSMQDGVISCSFISFNLVSTQRNTALNASYYLLFAYGSSSNGQIQLHTNTFTSANKVHISTPQIATTAGWPHIIKAHGALMLIAWMSSGSLGMVVARYLKGVAKGHQVLGKDIWFLVHVAVMAVTLAATASAFILAFIHAKTWSGGAHPVLGCLLMTLCFLQLTLALLRCGPQHPLRFLFNCCHALIAVVMKVVAVAAVFTGLKLIDSTADQWLLKVMGALVSWEFLFYVLLDINLRCKLNRSDAAMVRM
ncbi:putative ferric-chelate reductase 1 isoform X2 [Dunckerocampus dactyliophorus]|uniref:putative ferric-chelate reductase 1 isoform X2 n=1 Tax=Dunckerocampus dactyliophorus TaxID=161453 RepID=UPI00240570A4|nr:putative ferric-chelate reductase 1 isoform X2 [Dunckerocampus dactyliophorus]